jgi:hypothetical protein
LVNNMMNNELRETLVLNGFQFNKDYTRLTVDEGLAMLVWSLGELQRLRLRHLIYRVHPMPESFLEYVWDYGA